MAEYTSEKVKTGLKLASWYAWRRNAKFPAVFQNVIEIIETDGLAEPELNRVLDEYAAKFRRLGRVEEGDKLSQLAVRIRHNYPDLFHEDGSDIPWFRRESFLRSAPALPVEFRATRSGDSPGCAFAWAAPLGTVGGGLVTSVLLAPLVRWMGAYVILVWIAIGAIVGLGVQWRLGRARVRRSQESWCRLSEEGVEFHDPKQHCFFRWSQIDEVWTDWVSGPGEGNAWDAVTACSRQEEFQMTAEFFTEQEVRWVDGLCKYHSGWEMTPARRAANQ